MLGSVPKISDPDWVSFFIWPTNIRNHGNLPTVSSKQCCMNLTLWNETDVGLRSGFATYYVSLSGYLF